MLNLGENSEKGKCSKSVLLWRSCYSGVWFLKFVVFMSRATSGPGTHVRSNTCESLEVTLSLMIIHDGQSLCKQTLVAPSASAAAVSSAFLSTFSNASFGLAYHFSKHDFLSFLIGAFMSAVSPQLSLICLSRVIPPFFVLS